jgi:hypothetical protein
MTLQEFVDSANKSLVEAVGQKLFFVDGDSISIIQPVVKSCMNLYIPLPDRGLSARQFYQKRWL